MKNNPIILIDDDKDDLDLFEQAFAELKIENEILTFSDGLAFFDFISTTDQGTFFILCDINMNSINGLELKRKISDNKKLRMKSIPFLFFTTSKASPSIEEAYSLNAQGYFIKPNNFEDIKKMLQSMVTYWNFSQHPNS